MNEWKEKPTDERKKLITIERMNAQVKQMKEQMNGQMKQTNECGICNSPGIGLCRICLLGGRPRPETAAALDASK